MSSAKSVEPQLALDAFACPHCSALAHQTWFHVYTQSFDRGDAPGLFVIDKMDKKAALAKVKGDAEEQKELLNFIERLEKNSVTYYWHKFGKLQPERADHSGSSGHYVGPCIQDSWHPDRFVL